MIAIQADGRSWMVVCNGEAAETEAAVSEMGGSVLQSRSASLEEIFVARVGQRYLPAEE